MGGKHRYSSDNPDLLAHLLLRERVILIDWIINQGRALISVICLPARQLTSFELELDLVLTVTKASLLLWDY